MRFKTIPGGIGLGAARHEMETQGSTDHPLCPTIHIYLGNRAVSIRQIFIPENLTYRFIPGEVPDSVPSPE